MYVTVIGRSSDGNIRIITERMKYPFRVKISGPTEDGSLDPIEPSPDELIDLERRVTALEEGGGGVIPENLTVKTITVNDTAKISTLKSKAGNDILSENSAGTIMLGNTNAELYIQGAAGSHIDLDSNGAVDLNSGSEHFKISGPTVSSIELDTEGAVNITGDREVHLNNSQGEANIAIDLEDVMVFGDSFTYNSVQVATIEDIPTALGDMSYKGTLGTSGTVTDLPSPSEDNKGDVYKVIEDGEYSIQETAKTKAYKGDLFIGNVSEWVHIPSGTADYIEHDIEIDGNLNLTGTSALSADFITSNSELNAQEASITGNLGVSGETDLNSTLVVAGETNLNSTLDVAGETTIDNTLTITDDLTVSGETLLHRTLTVLGETTVKDKFTVADSADTELTGNVSINGTLTASQHSVFYDAVTIDGDTTIEHDLYVIGDTSFTLTPKVYIDDNWIDVATVDDIPKISEETGNAIVEKDDGWYVSSSGGGSTDGAMTYQGDAPTVTELPMPADNIKGYTYKVASEGLYNYRTNVSKNLYSGEILMGSMGSGDGTPLPLNKTRIRSTDKIAVQRDITYVISWGSDKPINSWGYCVYGPTGAFIRDNSWLNTSKSAETNRYYATVNFTTGDAYFLPYFRNSSNVDVAVTDIFDVQLEIGSEPTEYEPYIPAAEPIYAKVGDILVCDGITWKLLPTGAENGSMTYKGELSSLPSPTVSNKGYTFDVVESKDYSYSTAGDDKNKYTGTIVGNYDWIVENPEISILKPSMPYVVSWETTDKNISQIMGNYPNFSWNNALSYKGRYYYTFTTDSQGRVQLRFRNASQINIKPTDIYNIQIEEGYNPTSYAPPLLPGETIHANVGDMFISTGASWKRIPTGDNDVIQRIPDINIEFNTDGSYKNLSEFSDNLQALYSALDNNKRIFANFYLSADNGSGQSEIMLTKDKSSGLIRICNMGDYLHYDCNLRYFYDASYLSVYFKRPDNTEPHLTTEVMLRLPTCKIIANDNIGAIGITNIMAI